MAWMAPATEAVWHAMRRSVREGWPGLRLPPILLDGPPGIGIATGRGATGTRGSRQEDRQWAATSGTSLGLPPYRILHSFQGSAGHLYPTASCRRFPALKARHSN